MSAEDIKDLYYCFLELELEIAKTFYRFSPETPLEIGLPKSYFDFLNPYVISEEND